ncbi:MAG: tRNA 2-thiouridine(34) synthase MnmA [Flavobacteriales bacterium]|nr:tRNA 2-thiouridine(34) synthase MnmA [Flavobacteriales bacterium]
MSRIVVGLSGGVDSSVTAHLLKEQGHDVIGIFMRNWHDDGVILDDECPWIEDSNDALLVAEKLDIPFQVIDLSKEYKERIVDYMFREYKIGRTPNPDVLCNREIKFDLFLKAALELGADYVATGHYCRKEVIEIDGATTYRLLAGKDPSKDQSYFLCQVNQEQLARALFPIGELLKSEVREIARKADLTTAEKKDSQGLCFIGKVRLPDFLQQQLAPKEGDVIEIPDTHHIFNKRPEDPLISAQQYAYLKDYGIAIGKHQGAHYFTIGQRKGLGIGGATLPLFVIGTDVDSNTIFVGKGEQHPGLWRSALFIHQEDTHWIRPDFKLKTGEKRKYLVRIRYRQQLCSADLIQNQNGLLIVFDVPMKSIAPGQFAAWYEKDELIGSGVISE